MSPDIRSGELVGYKPRGSKMGFSGDGREETAASECRSVVIATLLLARGGAKAAVSGSVRREIDDASFMVGLSGNLVRCIVNERICDPL